MSRKGVIAKRVKTAPDGSIENQRPNAQSGWPRNECSGRPRYHRVRKSTADPTSDPGNIVPRSANHFTRHAAHDRAGKASLAAAHNLTYRGRRIRPTRKHRPTSGQVHRPNSSVRPAADRKLRPRSFRPSIAERPDDRPIVPTDRPNAAVDPKPFLKPNPHNSSPSRRRPS
ncbi:unnamed protein product [Microthlaspi erraticum]|uniref:Uncharacterized protein n=1 Tax=Microthlaspi erraticum TaxID=1685480 RepID=A0A6D2K7L4_9BRAS|nr:unnamed protein product [Microthlaspi erraticum]